MLIKSFFTTLFRLLYEFRRLLLVSFLLFFANYAGAPVVVLVAAVSFLYFYRRDELTECFLVFWYCIVLSDSRILDSGGYKNAKFLLVILMGFSLINRAKFKVYSNYYSSFLPFFIISLICAFRGFMTGESVIRTFSYLFTILIASNYALYSYRQNSHNFMRKIIFGMGYVFFIGLVLYLLRSPFVIFGALRTDDDGVLLSEILDPDDLGKYQGMFGNPNGLGLLCVVFFMFVTIANYYYPKLLTKKEQYSFYFMILYSAYACGSRGCLVALLIFIVFNYLSKRVHNSVVLGIALVSIVFYQVAIVFFVDIMNALDLGEYFRVADSKAVKDGSGRAVAWNWLMNNVIADNFFIGQGIGTTNAIISTTENQKLLNDLGHQGGAHNSYLEVWGDTGIIGLILYLFGWGSQFFAVGKRSHFAYPILFSVLFSASVESWLSGSLNTWIPVLVTTITLLNIKHFIDNRERVSINISNE